MGITGKTTIIKKMAATKGTKFIILQLKPPFIQAVFYFPETCFFNFYVWLFKVFLLE